jgi:hypothetical protein
MINAHNVNNLFQQSCQLETIDSSKFIVIFDTKEDQDFIVNPNIDKELKSLYRLRRKLFYNIGIGVDFTYFLHLTFADRREYESIPYRWYYNDDNGVRRGVYHVGPRKFFQSLPDILQDKISISSIIRKYLNRVNQAFRNNGYKTLTYVWKYEEGGKNHRPHVHMLLSLPDPFNDLWSVMEEKPKVVALNFNLSIFERLWNYGLIEISPIYNRRSAFNYIKKYFTKKCGSYYWTGSARRFSTSRNVKKYQSSGRYVYIDTFYDYDEALHFINMEKEYYFDRIANRWYY